MAKARIAHKNFWLGAIKLKRVQRALHASTETDAIERRLSLVISEYERNRLTKEANREFLKSGIVIRDVYGNLAE